MKINILTIITFLFFLNACSDLDLKPLSEGSSETWYSNETEFEMSVNDLYREVFWMQDADDWTDDWCYRGQTNEITGGTLNSDFSTGSDWWLKTYKTITRCNSITENLPKVKGKIADANIKLYEANACFVRATQYARLISHWGDAVYYTTSIDIDEAFTMSRTDKNEILKAIYADYDTAIKYLPPVYGAKENLRATKGAALAMKARIALYMGDYATARDAASLCMGLGKYQLYSNFGQLFVSATKNSVETIFAIPRSVSLKVTFTDCKNFISRNAGGYAAKDPSWDLFCAFLCKDGLPIDKSPLYNPSKPFENRDPRCTATIVEFGINHLGFTYQPHPDSLKSYNFNTRTRVDNTDNRAVNQYGSYNGLIWKKGIDADWAVDFVTDPDKIIIRYADVLLMYAEAKIELNEIDGTVLNAINQVRARAYGVKVTDTGLYPAVTTTDQTELRRILRIERRMEFALEGLRYMDIIRWKLAEKVLNIPSYGMLDPADLREKVVKANLWFFPGTPTIDNDGVADFSAMYNAGLIKQLGIRTFDATKQYLWPIPSKETLINDNLTQNPNY